jgi:phosphohistidine phosphatase SixA
MWRARNKLLMWAGLLLCLGAVGAYVWQQRANGVAAATDPATGSEVQGRALIERLRGGDYVVFMRHALAEQTEDKPQVDLRDRLTQRVLSAEGRAQAAAIGDAWRALRLPVGQIWSSPYFRVLDTAQLAFGAERVQVNPDLSSREYPGADTAALDRALRTMLSTPSPPSTNTVLVGHVFNLREATGVSVSEGGCAVFQPLNNGAYRLVGRMSSDELTTLAQAPAKHE